MVGGSDTPSRIHRRGLYIIIGGLALALLLCVGVMVEWRSQLMEAREMIRQIAGYNERLHEECWQAMLDYNELLRVNQVLREAYSRYRCVSVLTPE